MRIALVTDGIWPYVLGGMQKHSYYLCKYLAQKKVTVDLYHFNQSEYDISKLEFFSEDERKYINSFIVKFPTSPPFPGHYLYNSYRYSKRIFVTIKDKLPSYDFIYTKGFTGWELINLKSQKNITAPPIGVKFHGYEMFQKPPSLKTRLQHFFLLRKPVRSISQKADVVFSYGGKITEIIKKIGVAEDKIFELPSGVEESVLSTEISLADKNIKFVFLGRYERRKGIEELNLAITGLLDSSAASDSEFHFIGPLPAGKRLSHSQVVYHGEIRDKHKLQTLIRQFDVLVCPSWSEGMPNVILEAMANGLAVIATDVGATNVLVNDNTGWLIKSSDPAEIQRTLENVINTKRGMINEKKRNALKHIKENFTWEKLITVFYNRFFN